MEISVLATRPDPTDKSRSYKDSGRVKRYSLRTYDRLLKQNPKNNKNNNEEDKVCVRC